MRPNALILLAVLPCATFATAQDRPLTIRAGRVLDVVTGTYDTNVVLTIRDGRIAEMSPANGSNVDRHTIDLSRYTLLPGLMDVHTHLCDNSHLGDAFDHLGYPSPMFGIVGAVNARITLRAGFTTVRDMSEPFYCDVALRDAIENGWIEGPRVFASGSLITTTGGHGSWGNWLGPPHRLTIESDNVADGPDEARKAVRTRLKYGVDVVKVVATGGFGTSGTIPGASSFTIEELAVMVEEASKRGIPVAAHAHGADGIANAVRAGVRSIEHGSFLDDTSIALMKEHDVFLVTDLLAAHYDLIEMNKDFRDKALVASNAEEYRKIAERFARAYRSGVRVALGTDAGVFPHGRNAEQFALMVDAGFTPIDAIRSATTGAAELLGIDDSAGRLAPGQRADIIAVLGDPLRDVTVLERVEFVMRGGAVYVSPAP